MQTLLSLQIGTISLYCLGLLNYTKAEETKLEAFEAALNSPHSSPSPKPELSPLSHRSVSGSGKSPEIVPEPGRLPLHCGASVTMLCRLSENFRMCVSHAVRKV